MYITSHCPSMNHIWKVMTSTFVRSKLFLQNFNNLSMGFNIRWVISSREQISWTTYLFYKMIYITSERILQTQGWMHTSNSDNVIYIYCHFKGKPYSPTKSDNKKFCMSFFLQILSNSFKSLPHNIIVLVFYAIHH